MPLGAVLGEIPSEGGAGGEETASPQLEISAIEASVSTSADRFFMVRFEKRQTQNERLPINVTIGGKQQKLERVGKTPECKLGFRCPDTVPKDSGAPTQFDGFCC